MGVEVNTQDKVMPEGKWEFNEAVTDCFDDMLERSIPQYAVMRELVTYLAARLARRGTHIVDLGCSRGAQIHHIRKYIEPNSVSFLGLEVSDPMLMAASKRFAGCSDVKIRPHDLRRDKFPDVKASVTLAVLTLQFVPIEYRQEIVQDVYWHTLKGGAFVVVEKVLGSTAKINKPFVEGYLAMKRAHGYSEDQIERKRHALEGVLVPCTEAANIDFIRQAGFREIDSFWRWLNFCGWVAIK